MLEVTPGMGKFFYESSGRFGGRVKAPIKGRGEDEENTQV